MRGKASGSVTVQKLSCPGRRESVSPAATTSKEACIGFETRMLFSVFSEISASHCSIRHPVKRDTAEKMIPTAHRILQPKFFFKRTYFFLFPFCRLLFIESLPAIIMLQSPFPRTFSGHRVGSFPAKATVAFHMVSAINWF